MTSDARLDRLMARFGDKRNTGTPRVQAWCYLCGRKGRLADHRIADCPGEVPAPAPDATPSFVCEWCGVTRYAQTRATTRHYCGDACRKEARLARRRVSEKVVRAA